MLEFREKVYWFLIALFLSFFILPKFYRWHSVFMVLIFISSYDDFEDEEEDLDEYEYELGMQTYCIDVEGDFDKIDFNLTRRFINKNLLNYMKIKKFNLFLSNIKEKKFNLFFNLLKNNLIEKFSYYDNLGLFKNNYLHKKQFKLKMKFLIKNQIWNLKKLIFKNKVNKRIFENYVNLYKKTKNEEKRSRILTILSSRYSINKRTFKGNKTLFKKVLRYYFEYNDKREFKSPRGYKNWFHFYNLHLNEDCERYFEATYFENSLFWLNKDYEKFFNYKYEEEDAITWKEIIYNFPVRYYKNIYTRHIRETDVKFFLFRRFWSKKKYFIRSYQYNNLELDPLLCPKSDYIDAKKILMKRNFFCLFNLTNK